MLLEIMDVLLFENSYGLLSFLGSEREIIYYNKFQFLYQEKIDVPRPTATKLKHGMVLW
jgi:hypothetical protein